MGGEAGAGQGRRRLLVATYRGLAAEGSATSVQFASVRLASGEVVAARGVAGEAAAFAPLELAPGDVVQLEAELSVALRGRHAWLGDVTNPRKLPFDLWGSDAPPPAEGPIELERLSPRERQMLGLLVGGGAPAQVAAQLGLYAQTVRNTLSAVYRKLGVRSRAEAVARVNGHDL